MGVTDYTLLSQSVMHISHYWAYLETFQSDLSHDFSESINSWSVVAAK